MQIAVQKQQEASYCSFRRACENNYFGKASLISLISIWSKLPNHCIFADSLLIVSYVQGVLLIMFFHNNFSFILVSNKWSYFMICCFVCTLEAVEKFTGKRWSHEAFKVTENKTLRIWKWEFDESLVKPQKWKWKERKREKKWEK